MTAAADQASTRRRSVLGERRLYRAVFELGLAGLAFLLYFVVRANVIDRPDVALANSLRIVDAERALGLFVEPRWQSWILDQRLLVRYFNFVYFWLDFPLIAAVGLALYFTRRKAYTFARDAILFSGACALVAYSLFPVAPPRLAGIGVMDTLQAFNNLSYQAQSTSFFVNPYAAMPSLHVGWAVLLAIGLVVAFPGNRLVLVLSVAHVAAQWAATVLTGNHFLLDGFGGLTAAALGLVFASSMQRWGYSFVRWRLGTERDRPSQGRDIA